MKAAREGGVKLPSVRFRGSVVEIVLRRETVLWKFRFSQSIPGGRSRSCPACFFAGGTVIRTPSPSSTAARRLQGLVERAARFVDRRLLLLLVAAYAAAGIWPAAGQAIRRTAPAGVPLPLWMLAVLLFLAGLGLDGRQAAAACRRLGLLLAAHLLLWGTPAAAVWLVARLPLAPPPGLLAGLGLVALMPTAASSVAWSQLSRGNIALSVGLVAASTLVSPFLIAAFHGSGSDSGHATMMQMIVGILPAVAAGAGVGWWAGRERLATLRGPLKLIAAAVLLLLNYANASLALPQVVADFHAQRLSWLIAVTLGVCGTTFLSGWLLARAGRVEPAARHSLVFGIGMKNTGIALTLAALWLESQPLATVAIIAYTLTQHVLAGGYHARVPREAE